MDQKLAMTALGLEGRDKDKGPCGQQRDDLSEHWRCSGFVIGQNCRDFPLESTGGFFRAALLSGREFLQPVAYQPGLVAKVGLDRALDVLEVPVADAAAEPANRRFADANFCGD